eukprot:scaffold25470_cov63-Phaeocystis_antarctica.AAC.2
MFEPEINVNDKFAGVGKDSKRLKPCLKPGKEHVCTRPRARPATPGAGRESARVTPSAVGVPYTILQTPG